MKIGLVMPIAEIKSLGRSLRYSEIRDVALWAEKMEFDSIWLADHFLYQDEGKSIIGIWECWTLLSALAEATKKVQIGALVLCTQFRNPAVLAKMAHTLDEVSAGRFILGIGSGWNKPEFDAFGIPFDHLVDRFEEAAQIIHSLLKEGRVDFDGKYYQARNCEIKPRSPRAGGPPLLIGSGTGPRMLNLTAKYADMWNTPYTGEPETLQEPLEKLRSAFSQAGRSMDHIGVTMLAALYYPDLGERSRAIENVISGSTEEIARAMKGYEQRGVTDIIFQCAPYDPKATERLAESVALYRKMA